MIKIVSDGLFFYTKVSDNLTHEIIAYFNNNQGDRVTNIARKYPQSVCYAEIKERRNDRNKNTGTAL